MKPFTGPPTEVDGCAYSVDLDQPACNDTPAVHIAALDRGWGLVAFSACAVHADIARAAAPPVSEHQYGPHCRAGLCWVDAEVTL
ncbi:hypothetical protein Aph02nite_17300 [Actinoplanes philippinensis]|uniref:Uncharacterized protein n=1 Tax=Actinoplanes philippinensis TaxID=35752 RepID=A0A1I2BC54_9ACTN|nr:hypothetical protein [Actinoplanes philippinensis]GIE75780.1 hypothetical protein Aph02nite_17300 [Actinoplanes philippinensis]SFE52883.1 hypothetical protein SAMN05421541_102194 [Actinoplanes philippinensis]